MATKWNLKLKLEFGFFVLRGSRHAKDLMVLEWQTRGVECRGKRERGRGVGMKRGIRQPRRRKRERWMLDSSGHHEQDICTRKWWRM